MLTDELLNAVDVTAPKQVCRMDRIPFKTSDAFFFSLFSDWQADLDIHLEIQGA